MRNFLAKLSLLAFVLALFAPAAKAQTVSAMTGVVTDTSGAVVPDTTVTLTNPSRGTSYTVKTTSNGSYRFASIPAGPGYVVTFSHGGFALSTVNDLYLQVGVTRTQDVQLSAGTSTSVEVSANRDEVTLNTTDASVGNVFDVKMLNELPVQNRSTVATLFTLQPGVNSQGAITGARTDQSEITLDGMDSSDINTGQAFYVTTYAPVDAIQEFRGTVAGQPIINGAGGGGQYQMVTKSGTNQYHGNINEYHRDPATVANSWFNKNASPILTKPKIVQNQYGGAIGAPAIHDKLFYFFDFNNSRVAQQQAATRTVPLDSFRNGIIGYTNTTTCPGFTVTQVRRSNCPGSVSDYTPTQIAALDPQAIGNNAALFTYINQRYPHANLLSAGDGINTGGYIFQQNTGSNLYNYVGRVDYNLTPNQKVFARIIYGRSDAVQSLNQFDVDPLTYPNINRSYGYVVSHIWTIGNNKINQFYYGDTISVLKFPVNYSPTGVTSYSFGPLTAPNGSLSAQGRRVPIPEIRDDFNWTKGNHTIQFGGTFKFIKTHTYLTNDYEFATIGLGGNITALGSGQRPADISTNTTIAGRWDSAFAFALGRVGALSRNYNYDANGTALAAGTGSQRAYRQFQSEFYVGDTWKASPSLTLTYGLRYSIYSTPYETHGAQSVQDLAFDDYMHIRQVQAAAGASGSGVVPFFSYNLGGKANNAPDAFKMSLKDFAPRFGFSYNPTATPNTVLSGGFSVVYDRSIYNALSFVQDQLSYLFQNTQSKNYGTSGNPGGSLLSDPRLGTGLSHPAVPAGVPITKPLIPYGDDGISEFQSSYGIDKNFKSPYNLMFNIGLQQKVKGGFVVNANYVGRLGRRLITQADASQLLDNPDNASGQLMSTAFNNLQKQLQAGTPLSAITPQPWFEHLMGTGATAFLADPATGLANDISIGDIGDVIAPLQAAGFLNLNVGFPSQFLANTIITNKGYSVYHGGLLTVTKNPSHGLQFTFNYTFSHSMDNVSAVANSIGLSSLSGMVCDVTRPSACYGNSDFDVKHVITSTFQYELPFGHGRTFASSANRFVDAIIGGWNVTGIPGWRSGYAYTATSDAFFASDVFNLPGIYVGGKSKLKINVHKNSSGQLFLYDNPATAASAFRSPFAFEYGSRNNLRGPGAFTFDASLGKRFRITPNRVSFQIKADAFNVFNHPTFSNPTANSATEFLNAGSFGQLSGVSTAARLMQISGRIEF